MVVESASEIGLTRRLGEEENCKNRAQDGAILAVPVRMADRRECSDRKIDSQCRDQARWALQWCRFRGQKGNSGYYDVHSAGRRYSQCRSLYGTSGSVARLPGSYSAESCLTSGGTRRSGVE